MTSIDLSSTENTTVQMLVQEFESSNLWTNDIIITLLLICDPKLEAVILSKFPDYPTLWDFALDKFNSANAIIQKSHSKLITNSQRIVDIKNMLVILQQVSLFTKENVGRVLKLMGYSDYLGLMKVLKYLTDATPTLVTHSNIIHLLDIRTSLLGLADSFDALYSNGLLDRDSMALLLVNFTHAIYLAPVMGRLIELNLLSRENVRLILLNLESLLFLQCALIKLESLPSVERRGRVEKLLADLPCQKQQTAIASGSNMRQWLFGRDGEIYICLDDSFLMRGRSSHVFKGHNIMGTVVAMKVACSSEASILDMLMTEIDIMKELSHPHIITYLTHTFLSDRKIAILLEYASGGALIEKVATDGGLTNIECLQVAVSISDALAYLHKRRIAHRDIKLDNVLITSNAADGMTVKLCDFGSSKQFSAAEDTSTERFGTVDYFAPEVIKQEPYRFEPDMWSLGVLLFICLLARLPFSVREMPRDTYNSRFFSRITTLSEVEAEKIAAQIPCSSLASIVTALWRLIPAQRLTAEQTHEQAQQGLREERSKCSMSI